MELPYSHFIILFLLFSFKVQQLSRFLEFCNMEKAEDKEEKGKEFFLSDRLSCKRNIDDDEFFLSNQLSCKRNIDDEDVDLDLHLGPPLNDNSGVEHLKKSKIVNASNFGDKTNKNGDEFQFSHVRTSSLSLESEEERGEEEESQSLKHLDTIQKRWEKMKNIIGADKKNVENEGSSGPSDVSRLGSDRSLKLVQKLIATTLEIRKENSPILSAYVSQAKWLLKYFMIKMPRVSVIGDGPNGNKMEGLLFAYKNEEDTQIICTCHGDFLSLAEFVKHAGVGDVENPLRHIIINSLPMSW